MWTLELRTSAVGIVQNFRHGHQTDIGPADHASGGAIAGHIGGWKTGLFHESGGPGVKCARSANQTGLVKKIA